MDDQKPQKNCNNFKTYSNLFWKSYLTWSETKNTTSNQNDSTLNVPSMDYDEQPTDTNRTDLSLDCSSKSKTICVELEPVHKANSNYMVLQKEIIEQTNLLKQPTKSLLLKFDVKCQQLKSSIQPLQRLINEFEDIKLKFNDLYNELVILNKNRIIFEINKTGNDMKDLKMVNSKIKLINYLILKLNDISVILNEIENIRKKTFADFNYLKTNQYINYITKQIEEQPEYPVYLWQYMLKIENSIKKLNEIVKTNHLLSNIKQNEYYWNSFLKKYNLNDDELKSMTILKIHETIKEVDLNIQNEMLKMNEKISQENYIADQLCYVKNKWAKQEFVLYSYDSTLKIINNYDVIFELCLESISIIDNCKNIKLSPDLEIELKEQENFIQNIHLTSTKIKKTQQFILNHYGFFVSDNFEMKKDLRDECNRFNHCYSIFHTIIRKIKNNQNIKELIAKLKCQEFIITQLNLLASEFEIISQGVARFLMHLRKNFGRFQFIGDDDLLELCSGIRKPEVINKHINKIFPNLMSICYITNVKGYRHIINSVICVNNEYIDLQDSPIFIDKNLCTNYSLVAIFEKLQNSIEVSLKKCLNDYYQRFIENGLDILMKINENNFKIINEINSQILLLLFQLYWTSALEKAIIKGTLKDLLSNYQELLNILCITISRYNLKVTIKMKLEILIYEANYQMSIINYLIQKKIKNLSNPCWLELLRFYRIESSGEHVKDGNSDSDQFYDISIELCYTKWIYGFEVCCMLPENYLVRTPLVDKCFLSIADSYRSKRGSLLFGPAGTGKTESIKHLARYLGRNVYVFNCGDSFSESSFQRILHGASQIGAWVCFDEFNRMPQKSVMAALRIIEKIQDGLSSKEYVKLSDENIIEESKRSTILLTSDQINANENTLILLTLNLDYAGRYKLPNCVYKFFRPFSMSVPDSEAITNVILHVQGFHNSTILSTCLINFFKSCQKFIPQESHYDFGLRSLKQVISLAGRFNKRIQKDLEDSTLDKEKICVLRAIDTYLYPRLLSKDINRFIQHKSESFLLPFSKELEMMSQRFNDDNELDNIFNQDSDMNLFEMKQRQLYSLLQHNDCVVIFGKVGCGKSELWRNLMDIINTKSVSEKKTGKTPSIKRIVINPSNLDQSSLIGYFDPTTKIWVDGILPIIFRSIKTQLSATNTIFSFHNKCFKQYWIIFDGPIQSEWTESLNTLLDNTKSLTLPNGERLDHPTSNECHVKLIMETNSNDKNEFESSVTQSTISRVSVLYMDENSLKIDDLIKKGIDRIMSTARRRQTEIEGNIEAKIKLLKYNLMEFFTYPKHSILHDIVEICLSTNNSEENTSPICRRFKTLFSYLSNIVIDLINALPEINSELFEICNQFYYQIIHGIIFTFTSDVPPPLKTLISRLLIRTYPKFCPTSDEENFFDYMINGKGEWISMSEKACRAIGQLDHLCINVEYLITSQLIIPTQETIRMEFYLDYSVKHGEPVIFCGPPGTGKSMTIKKYIEKYPSIKLVTLNFNCYTTPSTIIELFDDHCSYSNPLLTGDFEFGIDTIELTSKYPTQSKIVLFFDEINMKQQSTIQTSQLQSFLKELFEYKSFYHPIKKCKVLLTTNITLVGACNPVNNTSGRIKLPDQLLHHCTSVVHVNNPSKLFYMNIYEKVIQTIFKTSRSSDLLSDHLTKDDVFVKEIIQKSIENYFLIKNAIQDTHPYFTLTLRDFTRWISKFLVGVNNKNSLNKSAIWDYWSSIGYHVFGDRFAEDECNGLVKPIICSKEYVSVIDENGQMKDPNQLNMIDINIANKWILKNLQNISQFDNFIITNKLLDQTMKIFSAINCGICSQNVILIGEHGTSKEWSTVVVSKLSNIKLININPNTYQKIADFTLELRNIIKISVLEMKKVIIKIKYRDNCLWNLIECINPLITNGDGLFLFDELEQTMIISKLNKNRKLTEIYEENSSIIKENDLNQQLFMKWFIEYVKFVIIIPKKLFNKEDQIINSHAFFNRCHVIWCNTFNEHDVDSIADAALKSIQIRIHADKNQTDNLDMVQYIENNKSNLIKFISCIHKLSDKKYKFTKTNFQSNIYKFIQVFQVIIHVIYTKYNEKMRKLSKLTNILKTSLDQLEFLENSTCEYKEDIKQKSKELTKQLKDLIVRRENAKKSKEMCRSAHTNLTNQESEISAKKQYLHNTIKKQERELRDARRDLENLERKQIIELKSMRHPPDIIRVTCELICELLEENTSDWNYILSVMGRDNFVSRILKFDIRNLNQKIRTRIVKKYLKNKIYTENNVSRACSSIAPIFKWAKAQLNYGETIDAFQPLRDSWSSLKVKNRYNKKELTHNQKLLLNLENEMNLMEEEHSIIKSKLKMYDNDFENSEKKIKNTQKLINLFQEFYDNWTIKLENSENKSSSILIKASILTALLIYGGHLNSSDRKMFMEDIKQEMGATCNVSSNLDMRYLFQLLNDTIISEEYRSSIKIKMLSNINEYFLVLSKILNIPTLLLYSDNFQVKSNNGHMTNYYELSFSSDTFMESLKNSLKSKNAGIIIYDVEHYTPFIYSLINRFDCTIVIDNEELQTRPDFQIILVSNNINWSPPEDWFSHIIIINSIDYEARIKERSLDYFESCISSLYIDSSNQTNQIRDRYNRNDGSEDHIHKEVARFDWSITYRLETVENKLMDYLLQEGEKLLSSDHVIVIVEKFKNEISTINNSKEIHNKNQGILNKIEQLYPKSLQVISYLIQLIYQFELIPEFNDKRDMTSRIWLIIKETIPSLNRIEMIDSVAAKSIVINFWNNLSNVKMNSMTELKVQFYLTHLFDTVINECESAFRIDLWRLTMTNFSTENISFTDFHKFLNDLFHKHRIIYDQSLINSETSLFKKWLNSNIQISNSKSNYNELKSQLSTVLPANHLDLFFTACSTVCDRSSLHMLVEDMFDNTINPINHTKTQLFPSIHINKPTNKTIQQNCTGINPLIFSKNVAKRSINPVQPSIDILSDWLLKDHLQILSNNQNVDFKNVKTMVLLANEPINMNELLVHYRWISPEPIALFKMYIDDFINTDKLFNLIFSLLTNCNENKEIWLYVEGLSDHIINTYHKSANNDLLNHNSTFIGRLEQENINKVISASISLLNKEFNQSSSRNYNLKVIFPMNLTKIDEIITESNDNKKVANKFILLLDDVPKYKWKRFSIFMDNEKSYNHCYELPDYLVKNSYLLSMDKRECYLNQMLQNVPLLTNHLHRIETTMLNANYDKSVHYHIGLLLLLFHSLLTSRQYMQQKNQVKLISTQVQQPTEQAATKDPTHLANVPIYTISELQSALQLIDLICKNKSIDFTENNEMNTNKFDYAKISDSENSDHFKSSLEFINEDQKVMQSEKVIMINQVKKRLRSIILKSHYGGRLSENEEINEIKCIFDTIFNIQSRKNSETNIKFSFLLPTKIPWKYDSKTIKEWITKFVGNARF